MSIKLLGTDFTRVTTTPENELGIEVEDVRGGAYGFTLSQIDQFPGGPITTTYRYTPGNRYKYVQAGATIALGDACMVSNAALDASKPGIVIPTAGVTDVVDGIAHVAIPSGSYGWITVQGRVYSAKAADAANAEGAVLGASATAGTLVALTFAGPSNAEGIAALRYAAGRRAFSLVDVGVDLWDVLLRG